ncbi:MAG: hypothetical protein DRP91_08210 [Candidatus Neomarinimicrobiota bacterium]|nr:MAG: hypothetical protein DRP91_08210 [Candidatus Neomarinimicrobiota bacterium]
MGELKASVKSFLITLSLTEKWRCSVVSSCLMESLFFWKQLKEYESCTDLSWYTKAVPLNFVRCHFFKLYVLRFFVELLLVVGFAEERV